MSPLCCFTSPCAVCPCSETFPPKLFDYNRNKLLLVFAFLSCFSFMQNILLCFMLSIFLLFYFDAFVFIYTHPILFRLFVFLYISATFFFGKLFYISESNKTILLKYRAAKAYENWFTSYELYNVCSFTYYSSEL